MGITTARGRTSRGPFLCAAPACRAGHAVLSRTGRSCILTPNHGRVPGAVADGAAHDARRDRRTPPAPLQRDRGVPAENAPGPDDPPRPAGLPASGTPPRAVHHARAGAVGAALPRVPGGRLEALRRGPPRAPGLLAELPGPRRAGPAARPGP